MGIQTTKCQFEHCNRNAKGEIKVTQKHISFNVISCRKCYDRHILGDYIEAELSNDGLYTCFVCQVYR